MWSLYHVGQETSSKKSLYAHEAYVFIPIRRFATEKVILSLFLICFGYSAKSSWLFELRVNEIWKSLLFCAVAKQTNPASRSKCN
jgi:hypothetical protein